MSKRWNRNWGRGRKGRRGRGGYRNRRGRNNRHHDRYFEKISATYLGEFANRYLHDVKEETIEQATVVDIKDSEKPVLKFRCRNPKSKDDFIDFWKFKEDYARNKNLKFWGAYRSPVKTIIGCKMLKKENELSDLSFVCSRGVLKKIIFRRRSFEMYAKKVKIKDIDKEIIIVDTHVPRYEIDFSRDGLLIESAVVTEPGKDPKLRETEEDFQKRTFDHYYLSKLDFRGKKILISGEFDCYERSDPKFVPVELKYCKNEIPHWMKRETEFCRFTINGISVYGVCRHGIVELVEWGRERRKEFRLDAEESNTVQRLSDIICWFSTMSQLEEIGIQFTYCRELEYGSRRKLEIIIFEKKKKEEEEEDVEEDEVM